MDIVKYGFFLSRQNEEKWLDKMSQKSFVLREKSFMRYFFDRYDNGEVTYSYDIDVFRAYPSSPLCEKELQAHCERGQVLAASYKSRGYFISPSGVYSLSGKKKEARTMFFSFLALIACLFGMLVYYIFKWNTMVEMNYEYAIDLPVPAILQSLLESISSFIGFTKLFGDYPTTLPLLITICCIIVAAFLLAIYGKEYISLAIKMKKEKKLSEESAVCDEQ